MALFINGHTDNAESRAFEQRRVGGYHALVDALVLELWKLDLQFPVIRGLVEDLQSVARCEHFPYRK